MDEWRKRRSKRKPERTEEIQYSDTVKAKRSDSSIQEMCSIL